MPNQMNPAYTVTIMSVLEAGVSEGYKPVLVQAPMPESFMYDAAVQYEAPFTQGMTGNSMIDTILRVGVASKLITQSMTAQIWQGSTETDLGLELEFQAEYDPISEVREPILQLMRLVTPSTKNAGLITSPGPKLDEKILEDLVAAAGRFTDSLTGGIGQGLPAGTVAGNMVNSFLTIPNGGGNQQQSSDPNNAGQLGTTAYFKSVVKDQISVRIGRYAFFDSVVVTSVQKTYESQFDPNTGWPWYAKVALRFKPLFMIVQEDLDKIFSMPAASGGSTPNSTIPIGATPPYVGGQATQPGGPRAPQNPVQAPNTLGGALNRLQSRVTGAIGDAITGLVG